MEKVAITSEKAPKAIGPYSQAVKVGSFIYCSGQIPIDPQSTKLISADLVEQSRQVLKNIKALLEDCGLAMSSIVKTTIFLTDMDHFNTVNEIYNEFFKAPFPARSTVAVSALPMKALIEIECIAQCD